MNLATRTSLRTGAVLALSFLCVGAGTYDTSVGSSQSDDGFATVVDGAAVETCGWPTVAAISGCTATLIHPKAISTAQHCGRPSSVSFGETRNSPGQTVRVVGCVGTGSADAQICELAEEVANLPVTPVLFGCELERYLNVGQPVVIAGFGQTSYGQGGGTKLWANQEITAVEDGRTIIGNAGDGSSPCPGDSGGPVFLQVDDGTWRVFGTVLGGTTGTPCNSATDFQRIDPVVANFESERGLDVTPCFDAATGEWEPGPDCGGFFAGDETGSGDWSNWCAGTVAGGPSNQCGEQGDGVPVPDGDEDEPSVHDGPDAGELDPISEDAPPNPEKATQGGCQIGLGEGPLSVRLAALGLLFLFFRRQHS